MHLTGSGKMQEQEGVGPTRTTRNPFDDEEDGRGEHGEAAPRVHTPSSARTPKDDKEEDGAMTKNPFGDDATVDSRFNKDNANVLKKPQNPFLSSSLDALQPAHRPVLPPRPPGPLPSPSTFPRGDTAAAPPLPSRPSVLASKKSTIFHSEPDALSRKPDPQSLLKSDSSPERRTLHHQPSLERFNALRIKDVVLNPETGSAGRKQPLPRIGSFPPIQHRGSIRALSVSHQVVVTCTQNVRIWDVASGENTKTVFLGEAKPSSVAFVPTLGPGSTEPFVWVGLEKGELLEINVLEGRIVARRSLHSSTLLHILRFRETSLVTIDEQGALKIWTDWDSRGFVSLLGRPKGLRVSPRLSVAYLYDDHLWLGAGKHLEVYNLAPDALTVLQKKLELPSSNFGNVTCITSIRQKLSSVLVYTGHDDGKLIEWDPTLFEKKRIFQLGVYRITSLFGLDMTALWVGFLTGKLAIYDLNVEESSLVKEFQAHSGSGVATLTHDQKSAFQLGRSHLLSASETGEIRVWDALLAEDWIDAFIREKETEFCSSQPVSIEICSWNIDSRKPCDLEVEDPSGLLFIEKWVSSGANPDLIVIGFQELVDLELKNVAAKSFLSMKSSKPDLSSEQRFVLWQDYLKRALHLAFPSRGYVMVDCRQMVGLFQIIFVAEALSVRISNLESTSTKTGLGGYHGNKGGLVTRFLIDDTSFCFVNAHLAAHQSHISARNNDVATIVKDTTFRVDAPEYCFAKGGDGSLYMDHENCFFFGDLNYRIDLPRAKVLELIKCKDWRTLQENDQLLNQMSQNVSFGLRFFSEGRLDFAPTFKYDRGSDNYDSSEKMRVPAWCDRVLFKGKQIELVEYARYEHKMSDHRPIRASFSVATKSVKRSEYVKVRELGVQSLGSYVDAQLQERLVHWTAHAGRLSYESALRRLGDCNWDIECVFRTP